jgi:hypothetical protein
VRIGPYSNSNSSLPRSHDQLDKSLHKSNSDLSFRLIPWGIYKYAVERQRRSHYVLHEGMHQTEYDTGFIPFTRLFRILKMQTNVDALLQSSEDEWILASSLLSYWMPVKSLREGEDRFLVLIGALIDIRHTRILCGLFSWPRSERAAAGASPRSAIALADAVGLDVDQVLA